MGKATVMKKKSVHSTVQGKMKGPRSRIPGKGSLKQALHAQLKAESGRSDIKFKQGHSAAQGVMKVVPIEERAGYPVKRSKGSVDPKDWMTINGKKVYVDFYRANWLPDDWGQGVKITNPTAHSTGTSGGTYTVFISPDGQTWYHKHSAEEFFGRTFSEKDGRNGQIRFAQLQAKQHIQVMRRAIKETTSDKHIGVESDTTFFKLLSERERKFVAKKEDFHFCVISARRATNPEGVKDIFTVYSQFQEAGVTPTWYVDAESLKDYQNLGLKAVVGGKLTPSRNKALQDAAAKGKVCVQCSDDISAWEYRHGKKAAEKTDDAINAAHAAARRYIISPVTAAQFMLAKMRASENPQPQLGGVYMLGSCSRTFAGDEFRRANFILGDFFVVDKSKVRFDQEMTLKEDYDFTASHIRAHGSVMRCERMTLNVKHYSNAGGAVSNRDNKGEKERRNIAILLRKWPKAFRMNPKRKNEVIMRWPSDGDAEGENSETKTRPVKKTSLKIKVQKQTIARKMKRKNPSASKGLPSASTVLVSTDTVPKQEYITNRVKKINGKKVGDVVDALKVLDTHGNETVYKGRDLRYDLHCGYLKRRT